MPNPENLIGKGFQPGQSGNPAGKIPGTKNRSTIARKVLEMRALFNADTFANLQKQFPEITKESTAEEIMTIIHLDKAITEKDSNSYKAIMDSAYGAPKQDSSIDTNITLTNFSIKDVLSFDSTEPKV